MPNRFHLLFSTALLLCAPAAVAAAAQHIPAVGEAHGSAAEQANKVYDSIFRELIAHDPEAATQLGLDGSPGLSSAKARLTDRSFAGLKASAARSRGWQARLAAIDGAALQGLDRINFDAIRFQFDINADAEERFQFGVRGLPRPYVVSQQNGAYQDIPDLLRSAHAIKTLRDAEDYLARLRVFATALDQETQRIGLDAAAGVVPPDFIIDQTLPLLRNLRAAQPEASEFATSLADRAKKAGIVGEWKARAASIVRAEVYPALDRQIAELQRLRAKASHDAGVWRLPNGDAYYAYALRYYTTTEMTADEVHAMGLRQVAEISAEIDRILRSQGYAQGTVGERLAALGKDPKQLYPNTPEGKAQLLADLNDQIRKVTAKLPEYFGTLPRAAVEVKRVPELTEAAAPGGYYMSPALDGSRPGYYYINLRDTAEWPRWTLPTLNHHEANPGHHWQIALGQEAPGLPVLRQVLGYSAFTEGWGLYAEQLADEIGAFENDPLGRVGYLQSLLFRATRLVVDTGIHHKRWNREQAIRYMMHTLGDQEASVISEVDRYAANPGQATSYKIGHTKIVQLREQARSQLGERFDLKSFHDAVLRSGAMPLDTLERVVAEWVKQRGAL